MPKPFYRVEELSNGEDECWFEEFTSLRRAKEYARRQAAAHPTGVHSIRIRKCVMETLETIEVSRG
jgi:hypothetical protein